MRRSLCLVPASLAAAAALLTGCATTGGKTPTTQGEQQAATPDEVLATLMEGNARYVAGDSRPEDFAASRVATAGGQYPMAYVLSCVDSRVPVETVFDVAIGDVFVGRVAGNFENVDQLGSMEFATAAAGSRLVLVLGHQACGAIKGAADGVELGNLTELLAELEPAVEAVHGHDHDRTSKNAAFIDEVVETNVRRTVDDIRERSPVLADLESRGKLRIVGAVYSLETGEVVLLN